MESLIKAANQIKIIIAESEKAGDRVPTVIDKRRAGKVHGVVFPRIMMCEEIGENDEIVNKEKDGPDMQSSFDNAERKWSDILN